MAIRCASKAIIIENGSVLLNRCKRVDGAVYYDLPGGGQKIYENLEQALIREVKEETGYDVKVDKFIGLAEEIYTSDYLREKYPEYTHTVFALSTEYSLIPLNVRLIGKKECLCLNVPWRMILHIRMSHSFSI